MVVCDVDGRDGSFSRKLRETINKSHESTSGHMLLCDVDRRDEALPTNDVTQMT